MKGLAAAAAAAMIFAGSWGLWGGQLASRVPVAHNEPGPNTPAPPQVVAENPPVNAPDPATPVPDPASDADTSGPKGGAGSVKPQQSGPTASPGDARSGDSAAVFISKPRAVTATLLRVRVDNTAAAREKALALAKEAGAACSDGASGVLEITAPAEGGAVLADRLAALGRAEVRETDRRDITADFSAALERYRALEAQLGESNDPEQRAQIEATMASLEKQLRDWDAQSARHVITLWLAE